MNVQTVPGKSYQMTIGDKQQYCVYAHCYRDEIFYIGQGRLGRPFDVMGRNAHWHQLVRHVGTFTIEIVAYFDTMSAARTEELRLISALQPSCNLYSPTKGFVSDVVPPTQQPGPLPYPSPAVRLLELRTEIDRLTQYCADLESKVGRLRQQLLKFQDAYACLLRHSKRIVTHYRTQDLRFLSVIRHGLLSLFH